MKRIINLLGLVFIIFMIFSCQENRLDKTLKSTIYCNTSSDTCKIFDATLKRTYEQKRVDPYVNGEFISLTFYKTGSYMVESWREVYRDCDMCDTLISFKVDTLPFTKNIKFNSNYIEQGYTFWRIEITWYDESSKLLKRKTVTLKNGNTGC